MSPDNLRRFCVLVFRAHPFSPGRLAEILSLAGVHWSDAIMAWIEIRPEFDEVKQPDGSWLYRLRTAPPVK